MNFKTFCKTHKPTQTELFSEFYDLFKDNIEIKNKKIAVAKLTTIITATFKLSSSQSFSSMTLRQLSDETQISMGGLYSYIKNKQQLSLYIHQFLNHFAERILNQGQNNLAVIIKTHIYLSEIMQQWFFFAFMESKNLNKAMRKYAIKSELMMEARLIQVIGQGQEDGIYNKTLLAETIAAHIKPLLHDWYLKSWKYKQRKISVDEFSETTLLFINNGLKGKAKASLPKESGLQSRYKPTVFSPANHKHLPHIDLPNHYQFITFRTHDSLDPYLEKLYKLNKPNDKKQLEIDQHLDASNKGSYLNGDVLSYMYRLLIEKNGQWYQLSAFNIMPNHIHLLIKPKFTLANLMQKIKGNSALQINKMLKSQGKFWASSYFDKLIRDEKHFNQVYKYIKHNHKNLKETSTPRFYGEHE